MKSFSHVCDNFQFVYRLFKKKIQESCKSYRLQKRFKPVYYRANMNGESHINLRILWSIVIWTPQNKQANNRHYVFFSWLETRRPNHQLKKCKFILKAGLKGRRSEGGEGAFPRRGGTYFNGGGVLFHDEKGHWKGTRNGWTTTARCL